VFLLAIEVVAELRNQPDVPRRYTFRYISNCIEEYIFRSIVFRSLAWYATLWEGAAWGETEGRTLQAHAARAIQFHARLSFFRNALHVHDFQSASIVMNLTNQDWHALFTIISLASFNGSTKEAHKCGFEIIR
jgi:hypothetical protein